MKSSVKDVIGLGNGPENGPVWSGETLSVLSTDVIGVTIFPVFVSASHSHVAAKEK